MSVQLDRILELPFEQYMQACWDHAREKAQLSGIGAIVYGHMLQTPAEPEALWARRYWFNKIQQGESTP